MSRRLGHGAVADVAAVVGTLLLLGVLGGVSWWLLVDPAELARSRSGGRSMGELQLAQRFPADGWYAVVALVLGFAGGLGVTWWRSRDLLLTTVLLLPGAAVAATVMAAVGRALGPEDPDVALATLDRAGTAPVELAVSATACYLMWPIAALAGAIMVLWSSTAPGLPAAPGAAEERVDSLPR